MVKIAKNGLTKKRHFLQSFHSSPFDLDESGVTVVFEVVQFESVFKMDIAPFLGAVGSIFVGNFDTG